VPEALRQRPQWVVWRYEVRDGKPTKVPYRVNGGRASVSDPASWATADAALRALAAGRADGIGFVFARGDPYCGVDLDHCRDPETGEIEPSARGWIDRLDSYTEVSPSGAGVHVIVEASIPEGEPKRKGRVETYDDGRFFCVTGDHLAGTPTEIRPAQRALEQLRVQEGLVRETHNAPQTTPPTTAETLEAGDHALLERARRAGNGPKFRALYDRGDWQGAGYASQSEADLALCFMLAFWTGRDPARIDRLFRDSALMRPKWDASVGGGETYGDRTVRLAVEGTTETYSPRADTPQDLEDDPGVPADEEGDLLLADRFVHEHRRDLMFVPGLGWYQWREAWRRCEMGEHVECVKSTARRMLTDRRVDRQSKRGAMQEPRVKGALRLAEADPAVAVPVKELDTQGDLLGTPRGTCDLRTGEVHPGRREERITLLTNVSLAEKVGPEWTAFLEKMQPDPDMQTFLQTLVGMALCPAKRSRVLPIFVGEGANGKSQFIIALTRVLGEYAHAAPLGLIMSDPRRTSGPTPELAALRGRRFVTVSESPEDGRLSVERVKLLTGGDDITARFLHANPTTFRPSHTVFLATNHRPRVADAGPAIWDRLLLVHWNVVIPPSERVPDLGEHLAAIEGPGILRWAVDGAVRYLRDGLAIPEQVRAATQEYRQEEDVFAAFLAECTAEHEAADAGAGELLARYRDWARARPEAPLLSDATLAQRLSAKGYQRTRRNRRTFWTGLRLLDPTGVALRIG
jgi:putative DNA primase/helicase